MRMILRFNKRTFKDKNRKSIMVKYKMVPLTYSIFFYKKHFMHNTFYRMLHKNHTYTSYLYHIRIYVYYKINKIIVNEI